MLDLIVYKKKQVLHFNHMLHCNLLGKMTIERVELDKWLIRWSFGWCICWIGACCWACRDFILRFGLWFALLGFMNLVDEILHLVEISNPFEGIHDFGWKFQLGMKNVTNRMQIAITCQYSDVLRIWSVLPKCLKCFYILFVLLFVNSLIVFLFKIYIRFLKTPLDFVNKLAEFVLLRIFFPKTPNYFKTVSIT